MRPSQTILVMEALSSKTTSHLTRNGVRLSPEDSQTVIDIYQQLLLLMTDLGYLSCETLERDATRLFNDFVKRDVLTLNNCFAELLHLTRCQISKGFKALCVSISPHLFSMLKSDFDGVMKSDVYCAARLIQLFSYSSRLTLHDIDLTQQCLDDYTATEERISSHKLWHYQTNPINKILIRWLTHLDTSVMLPKHGPGGVAGHGRTSLETKYRDLSHDDLLESVFPQSFGAKFGMHSTLDRISQTIFVPKSYKTFRTISMESSTLQYYQQGVWNSIDRLVLSTPYLRNRIGFHDQVRNQLLASKGSIGRSYATIDLSAASDSVSYDLVMKAFKGTPLLPYLVATRSDKTLLPDGRLITLNKFAPMGSALCFPVETLIFAAICEKVTHDHGVTGDYSVFGDDIIVPTQCVDDLKDLLFGLGFLVNHDKSFSDEQIWFRESCGAEFCDGYDVTPLRVSRNYRSQSRDLQITGLIDLSSSCYKRGYSNLRAFFLKKLRSETFLAYGKIENFVPLFAPTAVDSDNYTNYHTTRRWNKNLQRIECLVTQVVSPPDETVDQDEQYRLRHWLEMTSTRKKEIKPSYTLISKSEKYNTYVFNSNTYDGYVSLIAKLPVYLKNEWMEKPFEESDSSFVSHFHPEMQAHFPK